MEVKCEFGMSGALLIAIRQLVFAGFPVTCSGGSYEVVQGLDLNDFSRSRLEVTVNELKEERETVKRLQLV